MSVGRTVWNNLEPNPHFLVHLMTEEQKRIFRDFIENDLPKAVASQLDKPATLRSVCEFKISVVRAVVGSDVITDMLQCLTPEDRANLPDSAEELSALLQDILLRQVSSLEAFLKDSAIHLDNRLPDEAAVLEGLSLSPTAVAAVMTRHASIGEVLCLDTGGMMRLFSD